MKTILFLCITFFLISCEKRSTFFEGEVAPWEPPETSEPVADPTEPGSVGIIKSYELDGRAPDVYRVQLSWSWKEDPGEDPTQNSVDIFRKASYEGEYTKIVSLPGWPERLIDSTVEAGTEYEYFIQVHGDPGQRIVSSEIAVEVPHDRVLSGDVDSTEFGENYFHPRGRVYVRDKTQIYTSNQDLLITGREIIIEGTLKIATVPEEEPTPAVDLVPLPSIYLGAVKMSGHLEFKLRGFPKGDDRDSRIQGGPTSPILIHVGTWEDAHLKLDYLDGGVAKILPCCTIVENEGSPECADPFWKSPESPFKIPEDIEIRRQSGSGGEGISG